MSVYFLVLAAAILFASLSNIPTSAGQTSRRSRSLPALIVAVILVTVSSARWRVGTDYVAYEKLYPEYVFEFSTRNITAYNEPGIRLFAWLSEKWVDDSYVMFALASIVTISLSVYSIWKSSPAFAFSVAMYILSGSWHGSFNAVRQYVACGILLAGHQFLLDRKPIKWCLVVLIASLFHISALICLFFYFIPVKRTGLKIHLLIIGAGLVGSLASEQILVLLQNVISTTDLAETDYAERDVNILRICFAFVPISLFWILNVRDQISDYKAAFYVNMMAVYAAVFVLGSSSAYITRFSIYALVFLPISLAYLTELKQGTDRIFIRLMLFVLYCVFFTIEVLSNPDLSNFRWIFERP